MSRCKQSESVQQTKKNQLLSVFNTLVQEHGLGAISVALWARAADIGDGSIYLYFKDMDAVTEEWLATYATEEEQTVLRKHYKVRVRNPSIRGCTHQRTSRVTPEQVEEMRARYAAGERQTTIAETFGISKAYVSHLIAGVRTVK